MKRLGACLDCIAKRSCLQQQQQHQEQEEASAHEECSSAPARRCVPLLMQPVPVMQLPQRVAVKQHLQVPAFVEHVLERTLCDADAALHLTLHAMSLATQIYECGAPDAADRALNIAEQALAATVQQLARAQALVAHKAKVQHVMQAEEDADLQDTCSSSYSAATQDSASVGC